MGLNPHLLAVGAIFAFFDAFGIGANDVANGLSTAVNSGVFTMTQAAVCAVVFEFLGAITAGGKVSSTVQKGIMKASLFKNKEGLMQLGFTVALMASASWLQIANYLSLPVSTTHSIIGGVIGVATACFGIEAVQWGFSNVKKIDGIDSIPVDGFGPIAVSWMVSPIISGVLALAMFTITKVLVLQDNFLSRRIATNSFWRAVYLAPFFYSFVSAMLCLLLIYKGTASSANANLAAQAANDKFVLGLTTGLVALFVLLLAMVYVSYWQIRTTWRGEKFTAYEYLYFWALPARPVRAGFDDSHLTGGSAAAAPALADAPSDVPKKTVDDAEAHAGGAAKEGVEVHGGVVLHHAGEEAAVLAARLTAAPGYTAAVTSDTRVIKVVPPAIAAAAAIAKAEGYVVREMSESEKVTEQYRLVCVNGSWLDRLLCPVRAFLCHGVMGADGNERVVRSHNAEENKRFHDVATKYDEKTEIVFAQLQMMTSIIALFSHGSNDVANAMGPFSAIVGVFNQTGSTSAGWPTPDWILAFGGASIGLGFLVYGYHLMRSLGNNLTFHSPSRGYCMEFGAALTVLIATRIGLPISTTQCITGATIMVGMSSGVRSVNWRAFAKIFLAWVFTVPIVAIWSGLMMAFIVNSPNLLTPYANQGVHPALQPGNGLPVTIA